MRCLSAVILLLVTSLTFASRSLDEPTFQWAATITIEEQDDFILPVKMHTDTNGNTTIVSQRNDFSGIAPVPNGIHFTRIDASGQSLWTFEILEEYGQSPGFFAGHVAFDGFGSTIVFFQTADYICHVAKVGSDGTLAWHIDLFAAVGQAQGPGIEVDAQGNIFTVCDVPHHDGTFDLHILRLSPGGAVDEHETYFYGFLARQDRTHFTVTNDGIVVGMMRVEGLDAFLVAQKYDLNGSFVWQYSRATPLYFASFVEDIESVGNGNILVHYQEEFESYNREYHIIALSSGGNELWDTHVTENSPTVFNYLFGYVPHSIRLYNDNSLVMTSTYVGTEMAYPYGGFHTINVDVNFGDVQWEQSYLLEDFPAYNGGAASDLVMDEDGHTYIVGMAHPDDGFGINDFILLDYDIAGNLVSTTTYQEQDWQRIGGWLTTLDGQGNLYAVCRAEDQQQNGSWLFELRLLKFTLDDVVPPDLNFASSEIAFDEVTIGGTYQTEIQIQNAGLGVGFVYDVSYTDLTSTDFVVTPLPLSINPATGAALTVSWTPSEAGAINGQLLLSHTDPDLTNPFPITVTGTAQDTTTAVTPEPILPQSFALAQNYPNPFNSSTQIAFSLPFESAVELRIFDIVGREITTLVNGSLPSGLHTIEWNGTNANGKPVAGGVYFYQLTTEGFQQTRKLLYLK